MVTPRDGVTKDDISYDERSQYMSFFASVNHLSEIGIIIALRLEALVGTPMTMRSHSVW